MSFVNVFYFVLCLNSNQILNLANGFVSWVWLLLNSIAIAISWDLLLVNSVLFLCMWKYCIFINSVLCLFISVTWKNLRCPELFRLCSCMSKSKYLVSHSIVLKIRLPKKKNWVWKYKPENWITTEFPFSFASAFVSFYFAVTNWMILLW